MTPQNTPYSERDARHQLRICYSRRNSGPIQGNDQDGICSLEFPRQLRESLDRAYPKLITEFGWQPWKNNLERQVIIRDLGPSVFGLAGLVGLDSGHIAINPRSFDPRPELVALRRAGTVIHELVHLLQFQSSLFMHFYRPSSSTGWDPNWWLHESSALAAETVLVPNYRTAFCRLWDWAVKPQQSMDTDETGHLALPFILYLMDTFSTKIPACLYEASVDDCPSMLAVEVLSRQLAQLGSRLETAFLNYCVAVAPELPGRSEWLLQLDQIVGHRSYRERFKVYPINDLNDVPVHHLGCRYFRFKPDTTSSKHSLELKLVDVTNPEAIRAMLSVVNKGDASVSTYALERNADTWKVSCHNFDAASIDYAVLTVANCAYGSGWAKYDNNRFSLRAQLSESKRP